MGYIVISIGYLFQSILNSSDFVDFGPSRRHCMSYIRVNKLLYRCSNILYVGVGIE